MPNFVEQRVLEHSQVRKSVERRQKLTRKGRLQANDGWRLLDEAGILSDHCERLVTVSSRVTESDIAPEIMNLIPSGIARLPGALPIEM